MRKETKKLYKNHLKKVKEEKGFFPKDFKKTLKYHYKAMEENNII